jgi:DnaJ-class molecular chaperone
VPITLAEAIAGGEVPVPTPTGQVKLRIRPNTQEGQEIHLAGRGLPRSGKGSNANRGDLIVRVRVVLPRLDEEARKEIAAILARHPQADPRRGGSSPKSAEAN